jgi:hypothetical protein
VNVQAEAPAYLTDAYIGRTKVKQADETVITYDGSNAASLVGFWMVDNAQNRNPFTDQAYLAPVGQSQIIQYEEKGYTLTQTQGW